MGVHVLRDHSRVSYYRRVNPLPCVTRLQGEIVAMISRRVYRLEPLRQGKQARHRRAAVLIPSHHDGRALSA